VPHPSGVASLLVSVRCLIQQPGPCHVENQGDYEQINAELCFAIKNRRATARLKESGRDKSQQEREWERTSLPQRSNLRDKSKARYFGERSPKERRGEGHYMTQRSSLQVEKIISNAHRERRGNIVSASIYDTTGQLTTGCMIGASEGEQHER
jgi:hypothetical protein